MSLILLLEDSANQRSRIVTILHLAGYKVRSAADWTQCRLALSEFTPDLVLVDVKISRACRGETSLRCS